jgi:hypothetical protein
MSILQVIIFAGSTLVVSPQDAQPLYGDGAVTKPAVQATAIPANANVDAYTTGQTLDTNNVKKWEDQRKAYTQCPKCVASQSFPSE